VIKFSIKQIIKITLISILLILINSNQKVYADKDGGVERIRECDGQNPKLEFDEFTPGTKLNKEMDFNLSNPVCLTTAGVTYGVIKTAMFSINCNCNANCVPRLMPSLPKDVVDIAKATKKSLTNPTCRNTLLTSLGAVGIAISTNLGIIYETAKDEYKRVRVCGYDWYAPNSVNYTNSGIGSYQTSVNGSSSATGITITSAEKGDTEVAKKYREWFYGGKEFEDNPKNGENACKDPTRGDANQRYYFRGLQPANFLCERYNPIYQSNENKNKFEEAYKCCLNRSQNYICLEKSGYNSDNSTIWNSDHIFCKVNEKCSFKKNQAIVYETYPRDNNRLICAKSYSLCPYNFSVGGGTVYPVYFRDGKVEGDKFIPMDPERIQEKNCVDNASEIRDSNCSINKKAGKLKNYCQFFSHCTLVPGRPYVDTNMDFMSPYFSRACIDFIGDSQNGVSKISLVNGASYDGGLLFGQQMNFTAPIVQCFKETMANIFTNTFGHSKCLDGTFGNSLGECKIKVGDSEAENYVQIRFGESSINYKMGNKVNNISFFEKLQKRLRSIITAVLILSITFFGFKLLVGKVDIENKKDFLVYIIKIAIVIYFVNGDAWRGIFFDGIYNGSNEVSRIFFKIRRDADNMNTQKCNFGSQFSINGDRSLISQVRYPKGKEYLMVWDTLDCKIMQYLNYGPGFDGSTIFLLIIAAFFTGGIGITISMSVFIIAFTLISVTIRAMHIFISSAIAMIIYIFISPIIIPLILFERTKTIFDAWLNHLISFSLSPIVLFAYLAIFISVSEEVISGGARVDADGRVDCSEYCISSTGNFAKKDSIDCLNRDIKNPLDENVSCLLNFNKFSKNNGFALFGVGIASIDNIIKDKDKIQIRVLLIIKTALFLYVLSQFIDEIPGVISRLTGESIDVKTSSGMELLKKFTSTVRSIQKRGARIVKGSAKSNLSKARDEASGDNESSEDGGSDSGGSGDSAS